MHGVPPNQKPKIRKVLGVNAMTKGKLGDRETISELDYKRYVWIKKRGRHRYNGVGFISNTTVHHINTE